MKVTSVGIRQTKAQELSLTPELLAATGARYSRNNDGLEAILEKIEGMDQDKAVDNIFKMVDYGHRSISDMAPVAMFIDDISLWMALRLWAWCPTAGGQESSTRYVKLKLENIVKPEVLHDDFLPLMENAFAAYNTSYSIWSEVGEKYPELMGLPKGIDDKKKIDRLVRNYAFDRSRYFLPMCCQTNMMLVMAARGWVDLIKMLYSDLTAESIKLAELMTSELDKVVPRLTKHARYDESYRCGIESEYFVRDKHVYEESNVTSLHESGPMCDIYPASDTTEQDIVHGLENHYGRYDHFGSHVRRTVVRFGWEALTIAELRDLNRHRTGTKTFDLSPVGSYFADDQIEILKDVDSDAADKLLELRKSGEALTNAAVNQLVNNNPAFVYYLPLGAQCKYEHVTTADKFLYQCELRTGLGAHYTYAARMREVLELWHQKYPRTRTMIVPGMAEPE